MQHTHLSPEQLGRQPHWRIQKWLLFLHAEQEPQREAAKAAAAEREIAEHQERMGLR